MPVTKRDCRALLFLTLHLLWNPQMALMGGHRAGWQHIKWLKLMEIPHVQEHISKGLFSPLFYKIGHQQKVLFYHMWKLNKDQRNLFCLHQRIKRHFWYIKGGKSPPDCLHVIMCSFNHAKNILITSSSSHKKYKKNLIMVKEKCR